MRSTGQLWNPLTACDQPCQIALFVRPDDPAVVRDVQGALNLLNRAGIPAFGGAAQRDRTPIHAEIDAITGYYKHHLGYKLAYRRPGVEDTQRIQSIATPAEIHTEKSGTCIELVCLLAAALIRVNHRPLVVHVRRNGQAHALLGYWSMDPGPAPALSLSLQKIEVFMERLSLVEAVDISAVGDLRHAVLNTNAAARRYATLRDLQFECSSAGDDLEVLCAVDIVACRKEGFRPDDDGRVAHPERTNSRGMIVGQAPSENWAFVGRDRELRILHEVLGLGNAALTVPAAPQAIRGMGGVGKTQTARRYVQLYGSEYTTVVWVLGESIETFQQQFAALASDLSVPTFADTHTTYREVKRWFETNNGWLLVVDNAEDLANLRELLPTTSRGRVLLTTREVVPPSVARSIDIQHMDDATGAELLLRSAGLGLDEDSRTAAEPVSRELGGLALALAWAGAYMQERSLSSAQFMKHFSDRRFNLSPTNSNPDHNAVTVMFSLALDRVDGMPGVGKAAADLVRICAFLAPDYIPDRVFLSKGSVLSRDLARYTASEVSFSTVVAGACKFSLLHRITDTPGSEQGLSLHRLAQLVIRDSLSNRQRRRYSEVAACAVDAAFPRVTFPNWHACKQLLPHAEACIGHVLALNVDRKCLMHLYRNLGIYHRERCEYAESERELMLALEIATSAGASCVEFASEVRHHLAYLYRNRGYFERAVEIANSLVAEDIAAGRERSPEYALHSYTLARVFRETGEYARAASIMLIVTKLTRMHRGPQDRSFGQCLMHLAEIYSFMNRHQEAEKIAERSFSITKPWVNEDDPDYAAALYFRAAIRMRKGGIGPELSAVIESDLATALSILDATHDRGHPRTANCLRWLGELYEDRGDVRRAVDLYARALEIRERYQVATHPEIAILKRKLGGLGEGAESTDSASSTLVP